MSTLIKQFKSSPDCNSRFTEESMSRLHSEAEHFSQQQQTKLEGALAQFDSEKATLRSDISTLSSIQNCHERNIERLFGQIESLSHRTESIAGQVMIGDTNSTQIRQDVEALKFSMSKLAFPRPVKGFKCEDTIVVTVPGFSPLSEGIINYLTKVSGGNVCDRQRVHAFCHSVYSDAYLPRNAADLSTDSEFHSTDLSNQFFGYDFKTIN
jgi:hypothetical protein